jgi:hypothetical protein
MPLPKFESSSKYEEEIVKVSKEIKILYLKDKIKEVSRDHKIANKEEEIEKLREEISLTSV